MRPRDTTREAVDAQRAAQCRLGPARRVELAFEMCQQATSCGWPHEPCQPVIPGSVAIRELAWA
jgi:hypothetical protein